MSIQSTAYLIKIIMIP